MEDEETEEVIERLDNKELADMIKEMAPDDAVDLLNDLDDDKAQQEVLQRLDSEVRLEIEKLLNYKEDSAGGIMTPELCSVLSTATVGQAIQALATSDFSDPISVIFAVDRNNHLVGSINLSDLIAKPRTALIKDVVDENTISTTADEDQETIANNFRKYDLYVMPVVDENNILIGRITADDVMDVFYEEASEDIAKMAGAPDIERPSDSPFTIIKLRLPWLMITMASGIGVSMIVQRIIGLNLSVSLTAFIPVIMGMGGNTGMQASAVTVRSIALGEIELHKLFHILLREAKVGLGMGLFCGSIISTIVWIMLHFSGTVDPGHTPLQLASVVAIAMSTAMTLAAITGSVFPILLHHFKIDPAVASGPFVSTGNDLLASSIYLLICFLLLHPA
jgi:magnesium transporter